MKHLNQHNKPKHKKQKHIDNKFQKKPFKQLCPLKKKGVVIYIDNINGAQ